MEDEARAAWAVRLEQARLDRGFQTTWQAARALHRLDPAHLPEAKTLHRYWSERWEQGMRPNRSHRELIARLLESPDLFTDGPQPPTVRPPIDAAPRHVQRVRAGVSFVTGEPSSMATASEPARDRLTLEVRMAADESAEHAAMSDAQIGDRTVEQLHNDALRLAREYSQRPLPEVFRSARHTRDLAVRLLDRTRRPAQIADLYVIAGQSCGLLASATFEMGYWDASSQFTGSAHTYGDLAGHTGLKSWALGAHAILANWRNEPGAALGHLDAAADAPDGTATVRIRCIEARSRALLGDRNGTVAALRAAERARNLDVRDDLHDNVGGEFAFEPARQAFCAGSAYIHLGDGTAAEEQAQHALNLYAEARPEDRSYSAENGARIDLATARMLRGDLSGARDALTVVFTLPPARRVVVLTERLAQVKQILGREIFRTSRPAGQLMNDIDDFAADTATLPPGDVP